MIIDKTFVVLSFLILAGLSDTQDGITTTTVAPKISSNCFTPIIMTSTTSSRKLKSRRSNMAVLLSLTSGSWKTGVDSSIIDVDPSTEEKSEPNFCFPGSLSHLKRLINGITTKLKNQGAEQCTFVTQEGKWT